MSNAWLALRRAFDRLTLYLPLLIMALLAMGSWWLVRSMPVPGSGQATQAVRKDPDYHLDHFTTQVFDAQGRRIRQVSGDMARHYPDSDELHIDAVRFLAVNAEGIEVKASARRGVASGDGERVTLLGEVRVVRPPQRQSPRLELSGERLVVLQKEEKMLSDQPVVILRERDRFTASGLEFNSRSGQYLLSGRVQGVLQPRNP